MGKYKYVFGPNGENFFSVGVKMDGSLFNPNGYPENAVRAAVLAADARRKARRSAAAKKAAVTRQVLRAVRLLADLEARRWAQENAPLGG